MNTVNEHLAGSVGLLRAVEAASNWRAFVVLACTGLIALVLMAIGAKLGSVFAISIFFGVLALVVFLSGASAVGIMLMDEAKGLEHRGVANAVLAGIFTVPRFLALGLLAVLVFLLYILAIAVLFFVCKIPGIGAFLYAFVFPATVLLTGVVYLAFVVALFVLAAPMVWEGHGVMATLARLWTVLRQRLLMVYMNELLLVLLVVVVGALVMAVVSVGTLITLPLSAAIIGQSVGGGGIGNIMGLFMYGGLGGGDMSGYMYAGIFGSGILFFIASTIPGLVHTKGVCLIYLASVEGLEFEEAEAALAQRMAEVKQRAEAARERSMQATQRPAASAPVQPSAQTVSPVAGKSAISACPKCGAATTPGDIFCESCGQRLST